MALAPERTGIGIRRYFTTPGTDPYDTVTWERRDARITNWATGAVAFEQLGVEVPSGWSVNATNILAQKYFRGTLGTAEREWSLKQVADRVAGTIVAWGLKDGYFADKEEAEAFEAELKWLIIHQRAAFNSPVWFNIGVPGVPQQASACQPYDALVTTPYGLVPIGKLVETDAVGAKVYDAHGVTKVVAVKANGQKPVLRLHTKAGHSLDVTADHLVWRHSGTATGRFVAAGTLRAGDRLTWHRTESFGSGEISGGEMAEAALAGSSESETVPESLYEAPLPVVQRYLESLFQAYGYVSLQPCASVVGIDTVLEGIARGAQKLLARFGIFSRVRFKGDRRPDRKGCWSLAIRSEGDRRLFAAEIGFVDPLKASKLEKSFEVQGLPARDLKVLEIARVEELGAMDVYDIQTESGEYLSDGLRVHNCFILAVDDHMDSILNWYVEEGTIFKGGSGAGINLSRIRSSREGLRGGGTASGPVSFMRGADASAGTIKSGGKCFKEGTLVATPMGWRPIEHLRTGELVLTHQGPRAVADFMPNGQKQCYMVKTSEGYEVEVTAGHKFAYWDSSEGCFSVKPIEEFLPGDALYSLLEPSLGGSRIPLLPPQLLDSPRATTTVEMQFPTELDDRLAYVTGLMYGDAELRTKYPYRVRVAFCKDEAGSVSADRFSSYCEELFGERPLVLGDFSGHQSLGFTRKRLVDFLVVNGLAKGKAGSLGFPSLLFRAEPAVRAAFVGGMIDADGTYQARDGWSISCIDRDFLVQLQRLLLSLGVPSKLKLSRQASGTWRALYRLCVVGHTFIDRLVRQIAPYSAKAQVAYVPSAGSDKGWGYRPSVFRDIVSRRQLRGGYWRIDRALGSTNETSGYGGVATLAAHPDTAVGTYAAELTTCVQLTLSSITPTVVANTYDIEVEGAHLLSANGIYASNTRRAAKMVILDAGHPDIEDFIWCKAIEERKARALRDAGFDMDLDGKDSHSIQYQNANNSVRVTDEFMHAVLDNKDWELKAISTGEVLRTMKARELFRQIAKAAWECADPGMQFDTTINKWHTAKNTGRINASNPCFTGDSLVHTDKGLIGFRDLFHRANQGETFAVYTHDATNPEAPAPRLELTTPEAFMITGYNEVVKLHFDNGMEVRCTPGHRFFTTNRGYVEAKDLRSEDLVKVLDLPAPAVSASYELPISNELEQYSGNNDYRRLVNLPEKWDSDLAHYLGWMVGDGPATASGALTTVYAGQDDQTEVFPRHEKFVAWLNGGVGAMDRSQSDGSVQLRLSQSPLIDFFAALGLSGSGTPERRVPWAIFQAPPQIATEFVRGLFDANGYVMRDNSKANYVGLGSSSRELLVDVQRLLTTFGVPSTIWRTRGVGTTEPTGTTYDLRVCGRSISKFAHEFGFSLVGKAQHLEEAISERLEGPSAADGCTSLVSLSDDGFDLTYNLSEPRNHSYIVNGLVVRNCSEYMHLDNSACNLASLNLLTYLDDEGKFDVDGFKASIEVVFTGQEILVGNADYPTKAIGDTSRRFRQLGLGYANLGALLMAQGLPYDSEGGRAWAGSITALMTGHAYAVSARTAARMGPFAGFHENREPMLEVLHMHRAEVGKIDEDLVPHDLLSAAQESWDTAVETGEKYGVRNSQASVLAPTGCLVGGSLVPTERGLVRLAALGDPDGPAWQPLSLEVGTDEGGKRATKFFVNGLSPVVKVSTKRGHQIQGTPQHRVKVVDAGTQQWQWKRFADIQPGDIVPLALDQLVGEPQPVPLPPLPEAYWTGEHHALAPREMTPDLAELIGYFMGDGSLHSRGLRFCVTESDTDVVERLRLLCKGVFGLEAAVSPKKGHTEVRIDSVRVVLWWEACGFAKRPPAPDHVGKGYVAHIPNAVLESNEGEVYAAFLRGLFEADGDTSAGYPTFTSTSLSLAHDVQSLLLALGYPTTLGVAERTNAWGKLPIASVRLLNQSWNEQWLDDIGFISGRKQAGVNITGVQQAGRHDYVPLSRALIDRLAPVNDDRLRGVLLMEHRRGTVTRRAALELFALTHDRELEHLLGFFYDTVSSAHLGEEELTYDLSVPANVTYIANGFISHNTIGLLMDCDTTGIEPDLGLVKTKKLVGGGTMSIVNQTVPRALRNLGYGEEQTSDIITYIDEHMSIIGAPHLSPDHLAVFACSMGDNTIHYSGHVGMMAAAQPFLSGAISKTVNLPEEATVEEVEQLHIDAWKMGIKAIAIYRDNCKVAQPLATTKKAAAELPADASEPEAHDAELAMKVAQLEKALQLQTVVVKKPIHEHMPRKRKSSTFSFRVADCEGYVTVGEFPDGRPGEVFISVSKQGSTLAGIMDAFAISVSMGLQHGVPLSTYVRHFTNMRFEPAGMTDDPELRFASSLVDYIFRRLAVEYMDPRERMDLGVQTVNERMQPTLPGVDEATVIDEPLRPDPISDVELRDQHPFGSSGSQAPPASGPTVARSGASPATSPAKPARSDAPMCYTCGVTMQRAGSCFACPSCGTTSGCS